MPRYYYTHSGRLTPLLSKDTITILSIDPGVKNLALRIERRCISKRTVKCLVFEKKTFSTGPSLLADVIYYLQEYDYTCVDLVLVEKQIYRSCTINSIESIVLTFFMMEIERPIVSVNSKLKGKFLEANVQGSRALKKWSTAKALSILSIYGDKKSIDIMGTYQKKDDLADTVCQVEAFLLAVGILTPYK